MYADGGGQWLGGSDAAIGRVDGGAAGSVVDWRVGALHL